MNDVTVPGMTGCIPGTVMPLASRSGILYIESVIGASADQTDLDTKYKLVHRFSNGVYAREITIPKDHLIVGKIHKHSHLNILSAGSVSVLTEDGAVRLTAPCTFESKPGVKRVIYAHEEAVWTTLHGTHCTDPFEAEGEIIATTYDEYDKFVMEQAL